MVRLFTMLLNSQDRDDLEYLRHVGKMRSAAETVRACIRMWAKQAREIHQKGDGHI